jgi:hypothetical protein
VPRSTSGRPLSLSRPAAWRPRALATSRQPRHRQNSAELRDVVVPMSSPASRGSIRWLMKRCWASGCLLPGVPEAAHEARGSTEAPGRERKHRVRFMSVRRTGSVRQPCSMRRIGRIEEDKPQVSGYLVRLKSGRSPVRSRPWPPGLVQFNDYFSPSSVARLRIGLGDGPIWGQNERPPLARLLSSWAIGCRAID